MADYAFEQATTWSELQAAHDTWVTDYNHQAHWAHRGRDDGRESPVEVLAWTYGSVWDEAALHYAFYATRFGRRLDKAGYVRFRHYRLYAEPGLARRYAAVWLYQEQLSVAFNDTLLVQYHVEYQPDKKRFRAVTDVRTYETQYRSAQLPLWEASDDEWLKILRLPSVQRQKRRSVNAVQQQLFG